MWITIKDKIAFLPGKFQPPHIGHILSIINIYNDYDKIIIGITEGKPRVMTKEEVGEIFRDIFVHLPKIEIYLIKNTMDDESAMPYLPKDWDIIVTGNPFVIDLARKYKWKYRFLPRSKGIGYSGSELRKLYEL